MQSIKATQEAQAVQISSMETMQVSASERLDTTLSKLVASFMILFFQMRNLLFFPLGEHLSIISSNDASVPSHAASTSPCPQYTLNRNIMSIVDVWREYIVGLMGGPSVKNLEAQHSTSWRKESRFFSRMYLWIEDKAEEERLSYEDPTRSLERRRVKLGVSIDKLRKTLKE